MTCMMSVARGRGSKGKAEKGILGMREARGAFEEALGHWKYIFLLISQGAILMLSDALSGSASLLTHLIVV